MDNAAKETSGISFVVLILSKEEGKLIRKKEWPIAGNPRRWELQSYNVTV
jgi:hypothetical protein